MFKKKIPLDKHMIVSEKEAHQLRNKGYRAVDLHVHSSYSIDAPDVPQTTPEQITQKQRNARLIPVITDHETLFAYHALKKNNKHKDVISGVEIEIKPLHAKKLVLGTNKHLNTLHINVFCLNQEQLITLQHIAKKKRDLDLFVNYLKKNKLPYVYNHPFWTPVHEKINYQIIPQIAKHYFEVLELNARKVSVLNDLVMYIAQKFNKGIIAATDSHVGEVGSVCVLAQGKNFEEMWENVKQRKSYIVRQDLTSRQFITNEGKKIVEYIFDSNSSSMKRKGYNMSINIYPLEQIITYIGQGTLKNKLMRKTLKYIAVASLYTIGPTIFAMTYRTKENITAHCIQKEMCRLIEDLRNK